jgi:hypothetical protein
VIFVYGDGHDGCDMATRWAQANKTEGYYVVLKVFGGYRSCADQPAGWHQYIDSLDVQQGYSASVSPGFWKNDRQTPQVARDLDRFRRDATTVATSGAPFQLVMTYNEYGEGTAVESTTSWPSPSGHGAYLDIPHEVFAAHPRWVSVACQPSARAPTRACGRRWTSSARVVPGRPACPQRTPPNAAGPAASPPVSRHWKIIPSRRTGPTTHPTKHY